MSKNIAYFILISGTMWSFTQVPLENTRCANATGYDGIFNRNYRIN